ncbi:hypothetical protein [Streptomyces sp. NPDC051704]|uniref:hypothetical protein n=1 Tax=Streptomyces sp. NPDC051704 TaxID=3365671 RepID=UPI0037B98CD3
MNATDNWNFTAVVRGGAGVALQEFIQCLATAVVHDAVQDVADAKGEQRVKAGAVDGVRASVLGCQPLPARLAGNARWQAR